ncbi:MAG: signal peptide peptidase SppA [Terriglobia bacterium]
MTGRRVLIALSVLVALVVLLVVAGQLSQRIPDQSVLRLRIAGPVAEEDWPDFSAEFWEGEVTVFRHLLDALERARRDDRIAGVSLEIQSVGMSFGKVQELRSKLSEFVGSGKFCTAYLEEGDNLSYYLATACPEVYLTPTSNVFLTGLMGHSTFRRGTLDKLRIYPDIHHIAEYKTAKNIWTEKKYTRAHREMVVSILEGLQGQMVEGIATGRKLEAAEVKRHLGEGPYLAEEARERKLVDGLLYKDEYRKLLEQKAGVDELETISVSSYRERTSAPSGPTIAIVHASGLILTGKSGYSPSAGRIMGSDTVAGHLRAARRDDSVKAIVLRVDSGGGAALASEIIRRELRLAKEKKPVVASMSDVAASGGYWISMSANKIVADAGTLTGSIGVVYGKMNLRGLYNLLGLSKDQVALTPNATLFYSFQNFTPAQRALVRKGMRNIYDNFLAGVSDGRGLPVNEVDRIGKGRVWLGAQAKELGLVDEVGGLETAVAVAKELAGIAPEQSVSYRVYPEEKSTWEKLQDWIHVRASSPIPPPRVWLDPARSPLTRERALVLMPFDLQVQ